MFNKTIPRDGEGAGRGRVGLKSVNSSPPRPAPWCESKILPHPRPTTFAGREKPARGEAGRGRSSEAGQNCHPYVDVLKKSFIALI